MVINDQLEKDSQELQVVSSLGTVGTGKQRYTKKKISLVNPSPRNVLVETQGEFSRTDVKIAKAEWKTAQFESQF